MSSLELQRLRLFQTVFTDVFGGKVDAVSEEDGVGEWKEAWGYRRFGLCSTRKWVILWK